MNLFSDKVAKAGTGTMLKDTTNEFRADQLPTYAKSYILPKVMNRNAVMEARLRRQEQKQSEKRKSLETTLRGKRKVSRAYKGEEAEDEMFKFSMIKASLQYQVSKMPAGMFAEEDEDKEDDTSGKGGKSAGQKRIGRYFCRGGRGTRTAPTFLNPILYSLKVRDNSSATSTMSKRRITCPSRFWSPRPGSTLSFSQRIRARRENQA